MNAGPDNSDTFAYRPPLRERQPLGKDVTVEFAMGDGQDDRMIQARIKDEGDRQTIELMGVRGGLVVYPWVTNVVKVALT